MSTFPTPPGSASLSLVWEFDGSAIPSSPQPLRHASEPYSIGVGSAAAMLIFKAGTEDF